MNKRIRFNFKLKLIGFLVLCFSLLFFLVGYTYVNEVIENNQIYSGIFIEGVEVSGLTKEEAVARMTEYVEAYKEQVIQIEYDSKIEQLPLSEIEFGADIEGAVGEAYLIGRVGNVVQRYKVIKDLEQNPKEVNLRFHYSEEKIRSFLESIKNNFSIEPKNAIIQRINQEFIIEKEVAGIQLDIENTMMTLLDIISQGEEELLIQAQVQEVVPTVTTEYYEVIKEPLGLFYTTFNGADTLRTENLRVGASKINGTILHPNEMMSVHDTLSPITAANGYKEAPIIVNGEIEDGMGGGICQIATTLYNAVLLSELEVLERRNHSIPVSYIEKGKDAALFGDILDLKFKNNTEYPIYIESYVDGNKLYMNIYGYDQREANRRLEFESVVLGSVNPPPAKLVYDNTMAKGQRKVQQKEIPGYKVKLYKNIYINDVFVEKVLVNYSEYRATPAIIKVGTKVQSQSVETFNSEVKPQEKETEEIWPEESLIIEETVVEKTAKEDGEVKIWDQSIEEEPEEGNEE